MYLAPSLRKYHRFSQSTLPPPVSRPPPFLLSPAQDNRSPQPDARPSHARMLPCPQWVRLPAGNVSRLLEPSSLCRPHMRAELAAGSASSLMPSSRGPCGPAPDPCQQDGYLFRSWGGAGRHGLARRALTVPAQRQLASQGKRPAGPRGQALEGLGVSGPPAQQTRGSDMESSQE